MSPLLGSSSQYIPNQCQEVKFQTKTVSQSPRFFRSLVLENQLRFIFIKLRVLTSAETSGVALPVYEFSVLVIVGLVQSLSPCSKKWQDMIFLMILKKDEIELQVSTNQLRWPGQVEAIKRALGQQLKNNKRGDNSSVEVI